MNKDSLAGAAVGFIGLGVMGRGMAACLLRAGHRLTVHNRNRAAETPLVHDGALVAVSPEAVGRASRIVFLCLSDTDAVMSVLFGPDGLAQGMAPGGYVVDTSTISAQGARDAAQRLAQVGITYLDAPVSGGEQGAAAGTLSCMIGGSEMAVQVCSPVLGAFAQRIVHVGDTGAGQVAKACNQIAVTGAMLGVVEAFTLARRHGVDPARVREALLGGAARSQVLENNAKRLLERNFKPGFRAALMRKDLRLAVQAAQDGGACVPGAALMLQLLESACQVDGGDLDWSIVARRIEQLSGLQAEDGTA